MAAILGRATTPVVVVRESYWRRATGGVFSVADLVLAEDALVAAGFIMRTGDVLTLTPLLDTLVEADEDDAVEVLAVSLLEARAPVDAAEGAEIDVTLHGLIDDPARREALLLALGTRWDHRHRREVGAIGEEIVVSQARDELTALGHPDLARAVRQASLVSDQLGYDVVAPRVGAPPRLLEVKSTALASDTLVFLSRAEADTGSRLGDWALVVSVVHDVVNRTGEVVGWCQRAEIEHLLPPDVPGSHWQSVAIELERLRLQPGLPRPSA
ncbi:MAG: protein NO VEIN domain-containing protein [Acidimicrobiia bacterium]